MGAKASQKQNGSCVCLVTTGHPSTNPRLVKEADALTEAGYTVHVVVCKFAEWADRADRRFSTRPWSVDWVRFGPMAGRWRDFALRLRRRLCREVVRRTGPLPGLAGRAAHYVVPELTRAAQRRPADLYIAHNLAALPAAARAAEKHDAGLGFDAEDFHRGELPETPNNEARLTLTRHLEETYMPRCDYLTAASDGIAEAYADTLGVPRPTTILNVFPRSERDTPVPDEELHKETQEHATSLYWFSQTIGPDRGLEEALRALPLLPESVHLSLRGQWADGYGKEFMAEAEALGVESRVHRLDLVPPPEVVPRTAQHDIGLALEQPSASPNRRICVTNKLFTYLLGGVPFVATSTKGQRDICDRLPEASRLYSPGNLEEFAEAVLGLLDNDAAREAAARAGEKRYNWDVEKETFLDVVRRTVEPSRFSRSA
jgi:glycosyltransferase involved in cell wall biosynthesis